MEYVALGRTGLSVSVASLGAGGHSRLGASGPDGEAGAARLVRAAIEAGVNLIDTAPAYGTEGVVGGGIAGVPRERVVLSTKYSLYENKTRLKRPEEVEASVRASLAALRTDYIDIYHLHGVSPADYPYASQYLLPELVKLREKGVIRFLGITEDFGRDTGHAMAAQALRDRCWDVMMVGFHLLNQSARERVFPTAIEQGVGILNMFAVRSALSRPEKLAAIVADLVERGIVDGRAVDPERPLDFLVHPDGAKNVIDAAYRFCRYEPGVHSVLTGTGNPAHLAANLASLGRPPLPERDVRRARGLFGGIDAVSGN